MTRPVLLAVDGNSLTHRAYHAMAGTNLRDAGGRPTWAVKGFFSLLLGAIDRVGPDAIVVGFDDSGNSRRRAAYPDYKGTRSSKDEDLRTQLALIPQLLREAGIAVQVPPGLEADDVTAAAARAATQHGWDCVIVTSDRDAFSHISENVSVLRVINGGIENSPILTPSRFATMVGIAPTNYLDYAALRGDTSDNLPGVRGIGEKTASKLLNELGTMDAVWADVDGVSDGAGVVAATGKAVLAKLRNPESREAWARNRELMSADPDTALEVDLGTRVGVGHLPLAEGPLSAALGSVQLASVVRRAVRTLCAPTSPQDAGHAVTVPGDLAAPAASSLPEYAPVPDEPPFDPDYDHYEPAAAYAEGALHPAALVSGF